MCGVVEHEMEICPKLCICQWSVGCGMRLHASFATHTLKKQAEVYPHRPLWAVLYEESFNLKPCFRIHYVYIFPSRLLLIMNLHTVCFVHGKQANPSKTKNAGRFFLQRLLTPLRSKPFFLCKRWSWHLFNNYHTFSTNWAESQMKRRAAQNS